MRLRLTSFRTKLLLATAGLTLVPLAAAGFYIFVVVPGLLQGEATRQLVAQVEEKRVGMLNFSRGVQEDLQFLRDMPALRQRLAASRDNDVESLEMAVAEDWRVFSESRERYYQIRYIDELGYERVRVDRDGQRVSVVPRAQLQNKVDRYYFAETMKLGQDDVFVSPIDLNQERGEIEVPYRPVARYAAPVFREDGSRAGMVILNLDATPLLQVVKGPTSPGYRSFLTDEEGYYLAHPEETKEWGGPRGLGHGANLADDHPALAARLLSGSTELETQLWDDDATLAAYTHISPIEVAPSWLLVIEVPRSTVFAPVDRYKLLFGVGFAAILLLLGGLDVLVAYKLTRPLAQLHEGVVRLSKGERGYRLNMHAGAELQRIAEQFNVMAAQLEQSHATLEARVQEATESLRQRNLQLQSLFDTGVTLAAERSLEALLQKIADTSRAMLGAQYAALGVLNDRGEVGQFYVSGVDPQDRARVGGPPRATGMFRVLLREGKPLRVDNVTRRPEFSGFPTHHPVIQSLVGVPILARGSVVGDLYVGNKSGGGPFTDDDQEVISLLANMAGVALENARLLAQEQASVARLQELDRLKSDFVATVSHELRSPVASLRGYAQLLSRYNKGLPEEKNGELLEAILGEASRLGDLVEDVLSVSRIDSGRQEYLMRPLSLDGLAREVVGEVSGRVNRRTLLLRHDGEAILVRGDSSFLRQALLNLVDNALKFSPPSAPVEIALEVLPAEKRARVTVIDHGIGIAPHDLPRLFQKFSRIHNEETEGIPGTGLGLYIVKQIVEAHVGQVRVESAPGQGSHFIIGLPLLSQGL